jgi:2'-5' RNA ligase
MNNKLGLTSIIKLPPGIVENISKFLNQYKEKSNDPHFYNPENLHITLLGFIPMSDTINFSFEDQNILKKIFKKVFDSINEPIHLQVKNFGKTASSLYIKVKDKHGGLNKIRKKLIDEIIMSPLKFDEEHICSYNLDFGWCTIARFNKPNKYIEKIIDSKTTAFGSFDIQKISIVITDKCYSKKSIQELFSIILS